MVQLVMVTSGYTVIKIHCPHGGPAGQLAALIEKGQGTVKTKTSQFCLFNGNGVAWKRGVRPESGKESGWGWLPETNMISQ
jgi:hypothetical protein